MDPRTLEAGFSSMCPPFLSSCGNRGGRARRISKRSWASKPGILSGGQELLRLVSTWKDRTDQGHSLTSMGYHSPYTLPNTHEHTCTDSTCTIDLKSTDSMVFSQEEF